MQLRNPTGFVQPGSQKRLDTLETMIQGIGMDPENIRRDFSALQLIKVGLQRPQQLRFGRETLQQGIAVPQYVVGAPYTLVHHDVRIQMNASLARGGRTVFQGFARFIDGQRPPRGTLIQQSDTDRQDFIRRIEKGGGEIGEAPIG
jgi:hypothetical protein